VRSPVVTRQSSGRRLRGPKRTSLSFRTVASKTWTVKRSWGLNLPDEGNPSEKSKYCQSKDSLPGLAASKTCASVRCPNVASPIRPLLTVEFLRHRSSRTRVPRAGPRARRRYGRRTTGRDPKMTVASRVELGASAYSLGSQGCGDAGPSPEDLDEDPETPNRVTPIAPANDQRMAPRRDTCVLFCCGTG